MKLLSALYVILIAAFSDKAVAQTNMIELLKRSVESAETPVQKMDAVMALCDQDHSLNIDTLFHYADMARLLAGNLHDDKKAVLARTFMEKWLGRRTLYDSAMHMCDKDMKRLDYRKDGDVYARVMMEKLYDLVRTSRHKEALDQSYHFLEQAETLQDTSSQIYCKFIIGSVYRNLQQTDIALDWFLKGNQTAPGESWEETKNRFRLFFLIGQMYNWRANDAALSSTHIQDSLLSEEFTHRAIRDSRRFEDLTILANSLGLEDANNNSKKEIVFSNIQETQKIFLELNDTLSLQNIMFQFCDYYNMVNQPQKSVALCLKNAPLFRTANSGQMLDYFDKLGESYMKMGNYRDFSQTLVREMQYKDSIYNINSEHDLADLNAKYEDQKKENIIIQQKLDITSKQNTLLIISLVAGLLLIFMVFLYRFYSRRQKLQRQQEAAAVASAEEAERKRISADLHDNIGAYAAAAASTIATILPEDAESRSNLGQLKNNVQDMITQLNDSIWALNRKEVQLTAISDRFKVFIQKLELAYPSVEITLQEQIEEDLLLSPTQALHLFRIMQEGLNNALRHSQCMAIQVDILSDRESMHISITDNGIGMGGSVSRGNGINKLKMRALESGWQVDWLPGEVGGTRLLVTNMSKNSTTN
jgi:signal transduction histidine kinase